MATYIGYIYIRTQPDNDLKNICKLGFTDNMGNRDIFYCSMEYITGEFKNVLELNTNSSVHFKIIERKMKEYLLMYHRQKNGGGKLFYDKDIINFNLVENFLKEFDIGYKKLNDLEIINLIEKQKNEKSVISDIY